MSASADKIERASMGGLSFFFSYFVLFFLSVSNIYVLGQVIIEGHYYRLVLLGSGVAVGWWVAYTFFRGQVSVLIHEYKHAILATLVGNRWKRLNLKGMGGSFQYSYTKKTARYNAFISLAPYFLPVLTFFGCILYVILLERSVEGALVLIGIIHGAELYFNLKDATPIQTDLTDITGGFWMGLGYVIVSNTFITTTLIIGTVGGIEGLKLIGNSLWIWGTLLVATVRAVVIQ